jgi:protein SPA2
MTRTKSLNHYQRAEEQSATTRLLQKELEELKEYQQRESHQAQEDRDELQIYRDRCMKLEAEHELRQGEV